jgi:hypothetical protein
MILSMSVVARFARSLWAKRGPEALLFLVFTAASASLFIKLISGFLSPLQPSRALLNVSSFTFLSFILLTVFYGRSGELLNTVSKRTYFARGSGRFGALSLGVIGAVAIICYLPSLRDPFLFDDYVHLSNAGRQSWGEMIWNALLTHPTTGDFFFRPVGYISYWLDYRWAGDDPLRWHLWNVLVHAGNSILVYILARQLQLSRPASFFAGLVFAVHAAHAEATGWMAARFDLLAFLFSLVALIALNNLVATKRAFWFVAMVLATVLATLSKEAAFSLPLMALCMILFRRAAAAAIAKLAGAMAGVCGILFLYREWFLGGIGGYRTEQGAPAILNFHVLGTLNALLFRVWGLLFFPLNWSVPPGTWLILTSLLMLAAVALFLIVSHADRSCLLGSLALILAAALPVQHLLLIGPDLAGARVLYLPTLGLALFFGVVLQGCYDPRLAAILGTCVLVFQWAALQHNLRVRTETAELSRGVCRAIGDELQRDKRPILAEELPRTWKGVYFLSNGFVPCVAIQTGPKGAADRLFVDAAPSVTDQLRIFKWNSNARTLVETGPSFR